MKILKNLFGGNAKISASEISVKNADGEWETVEQRLNGQLVAYVKLTSPTNSVDNTGLDLDRDGGTYLIEIKGFVTGATSSDVCVRINNLASQYTQMGFYRQSALARTVDESNWGLTTGTRGDRAYWYFSNNMGGGGTILKGELTTVQTNQSVRRAYYIWESLTYYDGRQQFGKNGGERAGVNNITSIKFFTNTTAVNFGAGTEFKIMKKII